MSSPMLLAKISFASSTHPFRSWWELLRTSSGSRLQSFHQSTL
jgi:hypothetical protein